MVKKILSVFAIASMMLATSCSNEEFDNQQNGKESIVTFTAQLSDGLQSKTRAFADGTTAKYLTYAVYEVTGNDWKLLTDLSPSKADGNFDLDLKTKVSLRLANGYKYAVVFWADAENSIYSFDATNKKIVAGYTTTASNEETLDAFYAVKEITVTGTLSETVELKRPFAQLNIGTADLEAAKNAGHEVKTAGIKVKTYKTLHFNGTVTDEEEVTFALAALPAAEEFPVTPATYKYLTMNYLLMPTSKETKDVTISYDNATSRTFQNVPLQRNYRTNIYGNLLTSQNDFNIQIKPAFETPDNNNEGNNWSVSASTQEELNNVLTSGNKGDNINVTPADNSIFNIESGTNNEGDKARNITFIGNGTQTIDVAAKAQDAEGGKLSYQRGSSFTFKNMTIQAGEGNFDGIVSNELIFENCTIKGKLTLYGKATFIGCKFENDMANQYSIWTWGGTDVMFENCKFNTNGKAILLYGQATVGNPTNLTVSNCNFNDRNNGTAGKAAIEVGNDYNATYSLTITNCTVNGFADGKNTGNKLWANKNSMDAAHLSVTIDGTKIQ